MGLMSITETKQSRFHMRRALDVDIPQIKTLMDRAINELQVSYLTPNQIQASHTAMGLDTQLIEDGTYICVFDAETLVGCGGWSYRATLYGGNQTAGRNARRLDPQTERARIRAMYTHPGHTRRGIGRLILGESERAAKAAGFRALEMAATLAGEEFYKRCGYHVESRWYDQNGVVDIPLLTMVKSI